MTDQVEDQEVELDDNDVVEEAHDPKNAEAQSVASVDKAGENTSQAPARKGDKKNSEPMPKTKAGMINAMHGMMTGMKKDKLMAAYGKMMGEDVSVDDIEDTIAEDQELDIKVDFSDDLNALVESEATLSEEFKAKTAVIFEAAVKAKLSQEIDRLEEAYKEELETELASTKEQMVEKVDSYLNYVVETWMEENRVAVQAGLRTEIAETFMDKMKDLFIESYVEVPESKVDLVDELASANEELEESYNDAMTKSIALAEELEDLKRDAVIREASKDLAETQVEKLKTLAEDIDFEDETTFAQKVATIKEAYFAKKTAESAIVEDTSDEDTPSVEVSDVMSQYLNAIRKSNP
ncbi:MAG: hypothetical protein CL855_01730 [Cryomorphaceae bacterium]|nr:hypothetical protein [Cryomorphaceae bacterium]